MTAFSKGDILIGNIRPYLRKVWFSDRDGGCSGDVVALTLKPEWKDRVSPRFLYYVVSSVRFFDFYQATARGGSIPRGDKKKLLFFSFIVPCKQEQEHIVMTLDRFEELINDISSGLPAEIEARRTQYEYYCPFLRSRRTSEARGRVCNPPLSGNYPLLLRGSFPGLIVSY